MYTLRIFKNVGEIDRNQILLGDFYNVKGVTKEDAKLGIKLRVYGGSDFEPEDGIAIYNNDHAFIMMPSGGTFETLNRPERIIEHIRDVESDEISPDLKRSVDETALSHTNDMCVESLDPHTFKKWEHVMTELKSNRSAFKN